MHIEGTNTAILYGGVASEPLNGIAKVFCYGPTDCKWDIILLKYDCDADKLLGRYGFKGL